MTVSIYTIDATKPDFEFDITASISKSRKWTPTKRAVENKGNVADHVYREPFTISSNGFVAWTPISPRVYQPTPSNDSVVMIAMQMALEELAAKEDLVTLVSDVYTGPVVITSLQFSKSTEDGYSLQVAISFSEIEIAVPQTTRVNPSRLRPKVKKRAPTKGGAKGADQKSKDGTDATKAKGKASSTLHKTFG
jgi:hypothetical protein